MTDALREQVHSLLAGLGVAEEFSVRHFGSGEPILYALDPTRSSGSRRIVLEEWRNFYVNENVPVATEEDAAEAGRMLEHWLTSELQIVLLKTRATKGCKVFWRHFPSVDVEKDFRTNEFAVTAKMRGTVIPPEEGR